MQRGASSVSFLLIVVLAAAFVWFTSRSLPNLVASHFGAHGIPNGFMRRDPYVIVIICLCIALPLLVTVPLNFALRNPDMMINVPHREYWLAPQRRADTVDFVRRQMTRFGLALLAFICYVHWLVVKANEQIPPRLSSVAFVSALVMFAGFVTVWMAIFFNRFRNPP